jgi:hypothetical protein
MRRLVPLGTRRRIVVVSEMLLRMCRHRLFDLRFHTLYVEGRAPLHGWELDEALRRPHDDFLYEDKSPELVLEPKTKVFQRSGHAGAFKRVQPEVDNDWDIRLDGSA